MIFERLARGERQAFDDFIQRYGNLVAYLVRRSLGSCREDFDDAMQDAMLALWRAAPHFDRSRGGETTFIGTVVRRLMIDRRRRARVRGVSASLNVTQLEGTLDAELDERPHYLRSALERLRPDERMLVELAVIGGKTHAQIAQATGVPAKAVKRSIHHALSRLRQDVSLRRAAA